MVKLLEFDNVGDSSSNNQQKSNQKSIPDIAKSSQFDVSNCNEDKGLAISSNGMVAVNYNISDGTVQILPDNNLKLDKNNIQKFEQDYNNCKKLADTISKMSK